ncbi:MAG: Wzz/FepE/Etk N-terminal domain-containing protein [Alistipes indistinctus]
MSETPVKPETEEIDLLELAKKIWTKRRFIIKYALIGAVAGLVIGFSLPKEYTSSVKMAPEEGKSNMAGLAALAGFDLSGAGGVDGINLMLYPDVVQSTPFIVELSQIPVQPRKERKTVALRLHRHRVVVSLVELYPACSDKSTWLYCFAMVRKRRTGSRDQPQSADPRTGPGAGRFIETHQH